MVQGRQILIFYTTTVHMANDGQSTETSNISTHKK